MKIEDIAILTPGQAASNRKQLIEITRNVQRTCYVASSRVVEFCIHRWTSIRERDSYITEKLQVFLRSH